MSSLGPQILRPHQRDGVLFLWKIVTGQAENMGEGYQTRHGAILADEMGASSSKRAAPPAPQCLDRPLRITHWQRDLARATLVEANPSLGLPS